MLKKQVGTGAPQYRKPQWKNLREDIVDLFLEAQQFVSEDARTIRARIHAYRSYLRKQGFNDFDGMVPPCFYARQRARYTHHKIEPLKPPNDSSLECKTCGFKAHTRSQLINHNYIHHKEQSCKPKPNEPVVFTGTSEQIEQLKKAGWL